MKKTRRNHGFGPRIKMQKTRIKENKKRRRDGSGTKRKMIATNNKDNRRKRSHGGHLAKNNSNHPITKKLWLLDQPRQLIFININSTNHNNQSI